MGIRPGACKASAPGEARVDQLAEGVGAMTDGMLCRRFHLAEGFMAAGGHEYRVVAEAARAARRPDQMALHLAAKGLDMAIRPGKRKRRDEGGAPIILALELLLDARHGAAEIALGPGPARR